MKRSTLCLAATLAVFGAAGCSWFQKAGAPAAKRAGPAGGKLRESTLDDIEAEASRPRAGLRFVVSLDKPTYTPDQPIVLDLRLENITGGSPKDEGRDISVYFEPFAKMPDGEMGEWLFKFAVRSEKDEEIRYRSPEFDVKEADRAQYYHYVTLPPQSFVGRRFVFPPARSRNWLEPGRYTILVSYNVSEDYPYVIINRYLTSAHAEALGLKLAYVRVWTGQVFSNRVAFAIRKRGGWLW
jgi:hypothetical protein